MIDKKQVYIEEYITKMDKKQVGHYMNTCVC